jgi:hypothetical protein
MTLDAQGAAGSQDGPADRSVVIVVAITVLLAIGSLLIRVQFSVSESDEAFYLAMPYRFLLGARPFIDELNPIQHTSFLVYPLVKGFVALTGGTAGIILAGRLAYLAFGLCSAAVVAVGATTFVRWPLAVLIALACFNVIPWNIPNLSYNSLGAGFLVAGLFASAIRTSRRPWLPLLLAGVLHSFAVLAYPPLAIPVALFAALLLFRKPRLPGNWLPYVVPLAVLAGVGGALVMAWAWPHRDQLVTLPTQGGGLGKLVGVGSHLLSGLRRERLLLLAAAIILASYRWGHPLLKRAAIIAITLLPAAVVPVSQFRGPNKSLGVTLYLGLFSLVLLWRAEIPARLRGPLRDLLLPALVGGAITAYSSDNGLVNAGVGMVAALALTFVLQATILTEAGRSLPPRLAAWLPVVPLLVLVAILQACLWNGVYEDAAVPRLTARVETGPFKGLYTTPEKAKFVMDIEREVLRFAKSDDRVLFHDFFPAGYLMTALPTAANSAWTSDPVRYPAFSRNLVEYYERGEAEPTLVIRRKWGVPVASSHPTDDRFASRRDTLLVDERFEIYRVRDAADGLARPPASAP